MAGSRFAAAGVAAVAIVTAAMAIPAATLKGFMRPPLPGLRSAGLREHRIGADDCHPGPSTPPAASLSINFAYGEGRGPPGGKSIGQKLEPGRPRPRWTPEQVRGDDFMGNSLASNWLLIDRDGEWDEAPPPCFADGSHSREAGSPRELGEDFWGITRG
ncbi:hypothetical protein ACFB49_31920 [Sphingomonas sp. DBB INV C78]